MESEHYKKGTELLRFQALFLCNPNTIYLVVRRRECGAQAFYEAKPWCRADSLRLSMLDHPWGGVPLYSTESKKKRQISVEICRFFLVEARGVEPLSENTSSGTSPGADGSLHSRTMTQAVMLHGLVASFVMPGAKLTPVTCTTQVTPKPSSWSFWGGRPLLSSGENSSIVVL